MLFNFLAFVELLSVEIQLCACGPAALSHGTRISAESYKMARTCTSFSEFKNPWKEELQPPTENISPMAHETSQTV